jgi:hypothetical protein
VFASPYLIVVPALLDADHLWWPLRVQELLAQRYGSTKMQRLSELRLLHRSE